MANNIVGSLFGISPEQLMQQRLAQDVEQQMAAGRASALPGSMMSPSLAPFYQQATQQGQLIGKGVGALLGAEDPELQKVTQIKQLSSQFDLTSPQGMRQFAGALQQIAPNEAMMAAKRADEMEQSSLTRQKTQADITLQERKVTQDEKLREALAAIPEGSPDSEYLKVFRQFGSPDQQAKAIEMAAARRERLAAKTGDGTTGGGVNNNGVQVGSYDKTGRYKSPTGRVFTAKAVDEAQAAHDNAQDLVDRLQNLTDDDIKDAFGSAADYTTMTGGKLLGPTKTLNAQTKINEIGIRSVLTNLQKLKGASSDKEMAQMIKDFPGYQASPDIMRGWVDRATRVTNNFLSRNEKRFGFDTEYAEEGRFTTKKKESTQQSGKGKTRTLKSGVVVTEE